MQYSELFYVLIGFFISTFGELAFACGQCLREHCIRLHLKNKEGK